MTEAARPLIEVEDVSKVFRTRDGEIVALEEMSLAIEPGEIVSLVGASGCGKSTLLNMIAGFYPPSTGEVRLEGKPIDGVEPRCGMIFQSYALFPWLTVKKNVAFGPRLRGAGREEQEQVARRFIEMVGLEGFENAYPGELSGGMKQRVALCRALANEPEVLLCDEPFAALDAMTRQAMQQELLRIAAASEQTIVFVTHSIDEALIISDRIVVMSARPGRVKHVYANDLPRPRALDVQLTEAYLAMKRQVWSDVEEEVRGTFA
jgi:NitT/TauT family transport system ATP-binding protein